MNTQAIRELFELLLADFEQSETMVIDERSMNPEKDKELLGETIEEYREDLEKLLRE